MNDKGGGGGASAAGGGRGRNRSRERSYETTEKYQQGLDNGYRGISKKLYLINRRGHYATGYAEGISRKEQGLPIKRHRKTRKRNRKNRKTRKN